MKDILVTGRTGLLKKNMFASLGDEIRVILADSDETAGKGIKGRRYRYGPEDRSFAQLFDVYSFHTVVFVSGYADGGAGQDNEPQKLEQTLLQAAHAQVDKVIILSSVESQNYVPSIGTGGVEMGKDYYQALSLRAGQVEEMCRFFARTTGLKLITLRLPYLADEMDNEGAFLGRIFTRAYKDKKILLPYRENDPLDMISQRDLGDLLRRIVDEDEDESGSYILSSGYSHTYGELAAVLEMEEPELRVVYEKRAYVISQENYPYGLRKRYGWIPRDDMMERMGALYERFCRNYGKSKGGILEYLSRLLEEAPALIQYVELVVLFFLSELVRAYMGDGVYFRFVDVRLFYIVTMGTVHGLKIGVFAAVLSSIALFIQYLLGGMDWTILFYNVENWIPFAIYLMAGSITGYVKNKKTEEIKFAQEEYNLLRDKYIFLNEVYQGAVENKGEYKKQILSFKDSFGRVFDAVQKLDHVLPQEIFLEAILIMEDILENHSIAIYSVGQKESFGRLVACSDQMRQRLQKSIAVDEAQELFRTVKSGQTYKNTSMTEGMPVYANGIFREDRLVLVVFIYEADAEQYGMNYLNLFRILCGLVQTSILRALDYMALTEEKNYYAGTNVMRPERFMELLSVQKEMQEKGVAEHVLVRLGTLDKQRVSDILSRIIRTTDVIGEGSDGKLYLVLTQANADSFRFVENRLAGTGLSYQLTEKVG